MGYSERFKEYKFYDPTTKSIFESENVWSLDVEFVGGERREDTVMDFVFEEKCVDIPTSDISIDQILFKIQQIMIILKNPLYKKLL